MEVENRKGICTQIGICSKANSEEIQVITDPFLELKCSECGLLLQQIIDENKKKKRKFPIKKVINITIPIFFVGLLIWAGIALFSETPSPPKPKIINKGIKNTSEKTNSNSNSGSTNNPNSETNNNPDGNTNNSNDGTNKNSNTENSNLTANSIEEYLLKIGSNSIRYSDKDNLMKEIILKYFSGDNVRVIENGKNNTKVEQSKTIKDLLEDLRQRNYKIEITNTEKNSSNKITKFYYKEI